MLKEMPILFVKVARPLEPQSLLLFISVQLVALEDQLGLVQFQYLLALIHFLLLVVEVSRFLPL